MNAAMLNRPLKVFGHWLGATLIELDKEVNDHMPQHTFSHFGGKRDETISSAMGKAQARILYGWSKTAWPIYDYPIIPLSSPLGQLADDLCEIFEPYHCLKHISWDSGVNMEEAYPGIKEVVNSYLKDKGVKT